MKSLKNLFLEELKDMYDAEHRLIKALPKLAKAATCENLKSAFLTHLEETKGHVTKLEVVFAAFEEKPVAKKCLATVGLLEEGDEIAAANKGEPTINAALISAAQKVEHYEIASYGCLHEWAGLLANKEASKQLQAILDEEKAANETLVQLARASCNQEALGSGDDKTAPRADKAPTALRGIRPIKSSRKPATVLAR
jgi:ferritin-like metal-binding protein YciE